MTRRSTIGCALVALSLFALALPAAADLDLPALVRDLGGADASKRSAALTQLRNAKDPRVIAPILDAIDGWELYGRYYGVMVLEALPPQKVAGAFRLLLQKDDPYLRLCAATWFLRQGDERHVDVIVEALEKEGVELSERLYMVNRLYSLTDERIRRALFGLLDAEAPVTLLGAVLQALQYPEHEPSKEAVRAFLARAEKPEARLLAAAFLYRFGDETKKADIAEALASGEITSTAFYRLKTFLSQAGHVATEILDAAAALLATEENAYTCRAAVELLADFGHRKALPAIQKLADHEDANLAKAVFEAVVVLGGGIEKATLVSLLAHESLDRRVAAAELLRRMDDNSRAGRPGGGAQGGQRTGALDGGAGAPALPRARCDRSPDRRPPRRERTRAPVGPLRTGSGGAEPLPLPPARLRGGGVHGRRARGRAAGGRGKDPCVVGGPPRRELVGANSRYRYLDPNTRS